MDTIERVARIIEPYAWSGEPGLNMRREVSLRTAREVIEALRDNVTDGMIEAANNAEYFSIEGIDILYMMDGNKEDFRNVLRAGINAALNEEPQNEGKADG